MKRTLNYIIFFVLIVAHCQASDNIIELNDLGNFSRRNVTKRFYSQACDSISGKCLFTYRFQNIDSEYKRFFIRLNHEWEIPVENNSYIHQFTRSRKKYLFCEVEIPPKSNTDLIFEIDIIHQDFASVYYYSNGFKFIIQSLDNKDHLYINMSIIWGLIFLLSFLTLMNTGGFVITGRKDYGFYTAYTGILLVYFFVRYYVYENMVLDANVPIIPMSQFNYSIQPLFYVFYCLFARHFLDTAYKHKRVDNILYHFIIVSISFSILNFSAYFISKSISEVCFYVYRTIAILLSIYMMILLLEKKDTLAKYLVAGTGFLVSGGLLAMIFSYYDIYLFGLFAMNFFVIGIILEFLCFTLGMAQKTALETVQKLKIQADLNDKMFENQQLQKNMNLKLSEQVEKLKTSLEIKQKQQIETLIQLKDKENELNMLLSQMNPHFLFNSMSSLKLQVVKEDKNAAIKHLDQLSNLIRTFMEFTRLKYVSISQILENLQLYVDLESRRLAKKIDMLVTYCPDMEPEFEELPALLLQPIVENSLLHGLADPHIQHPKISIDFRLSGDFICIDITDNGIGRKVASTKQNLKMHNGIALDITSTRIRLLNDGMDGFVVEDLYYEDGSVAGTKVKLKLVRMGRGKES
jgi:sensor histidine kinase YesM